ncbi:MAG: hypothetical protein COA79_15560 [Planctomycetota bacterium]|nr:MAG: hypothetical protein COA79_15560 [Planctomycetota bacterium]
MKQNLKITLLLELFLFMLQSLVFCQEKKEDVFINKSKVTVNSLHHLPTKPGPHIKKIKAMGNNTWLNIGQAKADPKWGTARGRGYSTKMAYSGNLEAAFFCGTGVHGARVTSVDKTSQHHMDDLWAYDVNNHEWVCLYPGANVKTLDLKLNEHGFEVTKEEESQPVAYLSHAYNQVTFIPDTNQYMILYRPNPWWTKNLPQREKWLERKKRGSNDFGKLNISTRHPIFYNVKEAKWERRFIKSQTEGKDIAPPGMGVLEYIPKMKKLVYIAQGSVVYFDPFKNEWFKPKIKRISYAYDSVGCYDSKRERIYIAKGTFFGYFDLKLEVWVKVKGKNQKEQFKSKPMTFDTASGVIIFFTGKTLIIYNPDSNKWTQGATHFPGKKRWARNPHTSFYSKKYNVHYFYAAQSANARWNSGAFWQVYRYKNKKDMHVNLK